MSKAVTKAVSKTISQSELDELAPGEPVLALQDQDKVISELRAVREALAAEHDYDVARLIAYFQRQEVGSEREVREPAPKRLSSDSA